MILSSLKDRQLHSGLFFTSWGSSPAFNFGKKLHGIFAKGEEKT
jgi:hypothetical protein